MYKTLSLEARYICPQIITCALFLSLWCSPAAVAGSGLSSHSVCQNCLPLVCVLLFHVCCRPLRTCTLLERGEPWWLHPYTTCPHLIVLSASQREMSVNRSFRSHTAYDCADYSASKRELLICFPNFLLIFKIHYLKVGIWAKSQYIWNNSIENL